MSRKLVWILAGGAVVVLGGAAIWWWRRRKQKAAPTPEPDEASPKAETSTAPADAPKAPRPAFLARDQLGLFRQDSPTQASAAPSGADTTQPAMATRAAYLGSDEHGLFEPLRAEAVRGNTRRRESAEPAAEVVTAVVMTPAPILETTNPEPATETSEPEPKPPTVLIPKRRRKRYPVGAGQMIELRPDQVRGHASWSASRPDVEIRVLEHDDSRVLVALDGPAGEVNVALLCEGPKGPRPITSWKFEIVDKVA